MHRRRLYQGRICAITRKRHCMSLWAACRFTLTGRAVGAGWRIEIGLAKSPRFPGSKRTSLESGPRGSLEAALMASQTSHDGRDFVSAAPGQTYTGTTVAVVMNNLGEA